ncbi:MAG: GTP cyclohydrolase FolE2 [Synergistaceae bacterium]|jgi:GTP cyclohydrolase I|nr:GTP cyclohydrolase FolE2 [Synergistaceae bacterium]
MKDVQKERDSRNVTIDRVGVRNLSYPIIVKDRDSGTQCTVALVSMSVRLPHEYRGTHMSRFIETLEEYHGKIGPSTLEALTERLRTKLDATEADIEFQFPYFVRKKAPVSGIAGWMRHEASLRGAYRGNAFDMITGVGVQVQTLCPCSKEISSHGAHNQRTMVNLRVRMSELVWFEEMIQMVERSSSAPLYTLLKRVDEKYVTERAYSNPHFVEDVVRDLAVELNGDERITWYEISVQSAESIHNHDAFAELTRDKRDV